MPSVLDPRIISLSKPTLRRYADMIGAEQAFCRIVGTVGHANNRQTLVFAGADISPTATRAALRELENRRAEYLQGAKDDEEASRERRAGVGMFDTIADQSTQPPRIITRWGERDFTSENVPEIIDALKDRADFVRMKRFSAYRAGTLTLAEAVAEIEQRMISQRRFIENSIEASNYARSDAQTEKFHEMQGIRQTLLRLADLSDADALHVRIRSGHGFRFRARFPTIAETKWTTVPFTIANVAIVNAADRGLRGVDKREKPAAFGFVVSAGSFAVFAPLERTAEIKSSFGWDLIED